MQIRNEFAAVELHLNEAANGPRLEIRDLETGISVFVDPFLLRSLTRVSSRKLEEICEGAIPQEKE